jgi:uncharacterized protein (TIGR03437 family)
VYHGINRPMKISAFVTILCGLFTLSAEAQTFDTSGNGSLKGDYFVRQVVTAKLDPNNSAIGRGFSLTGVITFDGKGKYTFAGQMVDTQAGSTAKPYSTSGVYSVASNGLAQIQNPIDATDSEYGAITGIGPLAIIASATEGSYRDLFVAIAAGSAASNSSVNGSYQTGFIDFLQANASQVRDGYYTLISTGSGVLGSVTMSGAMANQGSNNVQQTFAGVTYSITAANGSGTITFPTAATPLAALVSGQKTLYVSSDGNLLLAGDPNGFDLILGVKSNSGVAANSMYQGTYFSAGLENNASDVANGNNSIDSFYGSTLALGAQGAAVSHFHQAFFGLPPFDFTIDASFNFAPDGTYNDGTYQHMLAANGQADLQVGTGSFYSLTLDIGAPIAAVLTQGPVISPFGVLNAANSAPITNAVAPGEFLTLYGSNLSSTTQSASPPLPTTLGGVKVTVNGRPARLSFVSPTQINLQVPFATTESYATLQVTNNSAVSNQVTLYTNLSAPGVFTLTNNGGTFPPGIGPAAVLHADNSLVTPENPAKAGETLQLYVTGLGTVTPPVADGAAAPSNPLSQVDDNVFIDIFDQNGVDSQATVAFAGLAPGYAGLYQINFIVPNAVASGLASLNLSTDEAFTSEAKLYMQ